MVNYTLIAFMILSIILLFVSMVLSAMASDDAKKGNKDKSHKYSMWSAIVSGVAVFSIVISLIVYIYTSRKEIAGATQEQLKSFHDYLNTVGSK